MTEHPNITLINKHSEIDRLACNFNVNLQILFRHIVELAKFLHEFKRFDYTEENLRSYQRLFEEILIKEQELKRLADLKARDVDEQRKIEEKEERERREEAELLKKEEDTKLYFRRMDQELLKFDELERSEEQDIDKAISNAEHWINEFVNHAKEQKMSGKWHELFKSGGQLRSKLQNMLKTFKKFSKVVKYEIRCFHIAFHNIGTENYEKSVKSAKSRIRSLHDTSRMESEGLSQTGQLLILGNRLKKETEELHKELFEFMELFKNEATGLV